MVGWSRAKGSPVNPYRIQIYADDHFMCTCCCPPPEPGHGEWTTTIGDFATAEDAAASARNSLTHMGWPWRVIDKDGNVVSSKND